eukprot:14774992-Heterocapsa_arctica.AAC.1
MLQPEEIEWQDEPVVKLFSPEGVPPFEYGDVGAVVGPRERTVTASEPIKHTGGYPQIAPTYLKKFGNWDY